MPNGKSKQGTQKKGAGNAPASSPSTAPACVSTPSNPNPPCSQHSVVVEFRPFAGTPASKASKGKPGYQGEFGFDWLRIYEWAGGPKNNPFAHASEEPYIDSADGRGQTFGVTSGFKNATTNLTETEAKAQIRREYNQFRINRLPSKPKTRVDYRLLSYFVPYLNLFPEGTQPVTSTKPNANKPFLKLSVKTTLPKPPCEAKLQLLIDIKYQIPHEIVLEYDPTYLQITGTGRKYYEIASSSSGQSRYAKGKTPKGASVVKSQYVIKKRSITPESYAGNVELSDVIKVKCIKAIPKDIKVVAYAYDKNGHKAIAVPIGEMVVCANDVAHQKSMKIALVRVDTNVQQDNYVEKGVFRPDELISLFNTLHQALILPDVINYHVDKNGVSKEIILDLTKDKRFHDPSTVKTIDLLTGAYLSAGCIDPDAPTFAPYLEGRLNASYPAHNFPRDYFLAFNFGEHVYDNSFGLASSKTVAGKLICRSSVSMFPLRDPATLPHELLHTLQLFHTHDDNQPPPPRPPKPPKPLFPAQQYTFPYGTTTNVMSYNPVVCYSTWKWQWEIMRRNATNIIR
jgi:hypothetical protein